MGVLGSCLIFKIIKGFFLGSVGERGNRKEERI